MQDMTEEDRAKARNKERLDDDPMQFWMMFCAASMAGGKPVGQAFRDADSVIDEARRRFC